MPTITPLMVGTSELALSAVKTPNGFKWGLMDVSSSDSGRLNDANASMKKNRVAQKRKISLTWNNASEEDTAAILQAFDPEYVYVRYRDPQVADWQIRQFYVGDRSAPVSQFTVNGVIYSTVSFDIIEV